MTIKAYFYSTTVYDRNVRDDNAFFFHNLFTVPITNFLFNFNYNHGFRPYLNSPIVPDRRAAIFDTISNKNHDVIYKLTTPDDFLPVKPHHRFPFQGCRSFNDPCSRVSTYILTGGHIRICSDSKLNASKF